MFDYTNTPTQITLLEKYIGQSGWLQVQHLAISSFEHEDYVLLACFTDEGEQIDQETAQRLFSLYATVNHKIAKPTDVTMKANKMIEHLKHELVHENANRNRDFFDVEMDKLDQWADDMKIGLEREIKDLDAEIKLRKAEAKKLLDLNAKVKAQRHIKELEKKRSEKREALFSAQDDIDEKKEDLLSNIEKMLNQKIKQEELFTIKWAIV